MGKKKKDTILDDYRKIQDEIKFDNVNEIFRTQPDNYIQALEEIGFTYVEDDDYEEMEERNAKPENPTQEKLVAYFEGTGELSASILEAFFDERDAEEPNYPLFRKYFKQANQNLKAMLLLGLELFPARVDLLDDLAYFHEFENILSTLIKHYTHACVMEQDTQTFSELAQDFYYATNPDGYEALYALRDLFEPGSSKRTIIDFLIEEQKEAEKSVVDDISF